MRVTASLSLFPVLGNVEASCVQKLLRTLFSINWTYFDKMDSITKSHLAFHSLTPRGKKSPFLPILNLPPMTLNTYQCYEKERKGRLFRALIISLIIFPVNEERPSCVTFPYGKIQGV